MLKCIVIDDEPLALRQIENFISKISYLESVHYCNSALKAHAFLADNSVDLIFVDISMPDLNGIDFVKSLTQRPMIIFTTAYSEYAIDGFKLDAIDYLLKPFNFLEFSRAASKAFSLYELRQNQRASDSEATVKDAEYISVKADYKISLIKISDIIYIESEGEYIRIHLNDSKTITTLFRLKNMELALPSDKFMRIHRSYIVNITEIKSYVKGKVFLNDTDYLPIGDMYKETFQTYFERYFSNF